VQKYEAALKDLESHKDLADPLHPMQIKKALARSIVTEYHSQSAAKQAEEQFEKVVQRKEIPDTIPLRCYQEKSIVAYEMIAGLAGISTSEARRLLSQGAVKIDGTKISDPGQQISIGSEEQTIQVGKRKFFRVKVEETSRS
jgi:tyrosyl-tRNA synthetase